jgi:hypothetical protein
MFADNFYILNDLIAWTIKLRLFWILSKRLCSRPLLGVRAKRIYLFDIMIDVVVVSG